MQHWKRKEIKCNKEELRPPGAAPRGPHKNQRPGGTLSIYSSLNTSKTNLTYSYSSSNQTGQASWIG
jgi:hypothetical protein